MPTILSNSTIYIGKNLFGKASTVTCPDIDIKTIEQQIGYGTMELPVGVNALKTSVTITGFDKDVFSKISNPFQEINMTVYGSIDEYTNETLSSSKQAKLVLRGASQKFGLLGELKQQENIEYPIDFNVSAAKLYIDGKEMFAIDVPNLIWRKDGIDLLATIKRNLALN